MDAVLLSRLQMAFTLSYHILFPTLTIGLAGFLVWLEARWLRSRRAEFLTLYRFWSKIFALSFGMGVVSGVVLSYEFGTNFAPFSAITGNVIGPLMSYEVLSAFFLEAGFLGVMLFGQNRVPPWLHFFATLMVAVGTLMSAFWILAANSWMQTPAGTELIDGRFVVTDWWAVIFNPSFPYRFSHMLVASFLTTAFVVLGVSAWQWRRNQPDREHGASSAIKMALAMALVMAPLQILLGDLHGLQVKRDQPIKVAAMEGVWETERGAPLLLFALPDMHAERNHYEIGIPKLASWILTHDPDGEIIGLKTVPASDRPNVPLVFWSFRVMVGCGLLMLLFAGWGAWRWWRRRLVHDGLWLRSLPWLIPTGFVATLAGWWVAEVGRQPWLVYGLLRTADGASPLPAERIAESLLLFVVVYSLLFALYLFYLKRVVQNGLAAVAAQPLTPLLPRSTAVSLDEPTGQKE